MTAKELYQRLVASPKAISDPFVHKCAVPSPDEIRETGVRNWTCDSCKRPWSFSVHVVDGNEVIACLHVAPEPN